MSKADIETDTCSAALLALSAWDMRIALEMPHSAAGTYCHLLLDQTLSVAKSAKFSYTAQSSKTVVVIAPQGLRNLTVCASVLLSVWTEGCALSISS